MRYLLGLALTLALGIAFLELSKNQNEPAEKLAESSQPPQGDTEKKLKVDNFETIKQSSEKTVKENPPKLDKYSQEECNSRFEDFFFNGYKYSHIMPCLTKQSDLIAKFNENCDSEECQISKKVDDAIIVLEASENLNSRDLSVPILLQRLLALSSTNASSSDILLTADQILEIDPKLAAVRDIKVAALFAEYKKGAEIDADLIHDEINLAHEYNDKSADLLNSIKVEILISLENGEDFSHLLQKYRALLSSGTFYYLSAINSKILGQKSQMLYFIDKAVTAEPANPTYLNTQKKLLEAKDPLGVQGAFQISLEVHEGIL